MLFLPVGEVRNEEKYDRDEDDRAAGREPERIGEKKSDEHGKERDDDRECERATESEIPLKRRKDRHRHERPDEQRTDRLERHRDDHGRHHRESDREPPDMDSGHLRQVLAQNQEKKRSSEEKEKAKRENRDPASHPDIRIRHRRDTPEKIREDIARQSAGETHDDDGERERSREKNNER